MLRGGMVQTVCGMEFLESGYWLVCYWLVCCLWFCNLNWKSNWNSIGVGKWTRDGLVRRLLRGRSWVRTLHARWNWFSALLWLEEVSK